jgi:phage antirepressor YoqD-like protein
VFDTENNGWVVLKRMCEVLGLDANAQKQRLDRSHWATACMIHAVGNDGKQREMYCVSVDTVPMWLATIDANRCQESVRPKLELFQKEAAKVLANWAKGMFYQSMLPQDYLSAMKALVVSTETNMELTKLNNQLINRVAVAIQKETLHDTIMAANDSLSMQEVAALLNIPGLGRNTLFEFLRNIKVLNECNLPYRHYIDMGLFRVIETPYQGSNGQTKAQCVTRVHQKGVGFILRQLIKHGVVADGKLQSSKYIR